jgi:uncharacterized repeat protein (TIGR03803 family)
MYIPTFYKSIVQVALFFAVNSLALAAYTQSTVTETDLYNFAVGPYGEHPITSLIQASDGNFYGVLQEDYFVGSAFGSIYRISSAGDWQEIYAFTNGQDGGQPEASLIEGPDGALYGVTSQGGASGHEGTAFRITLDGQLTTLYFFSNIYNGINPQTPLTLGSDGKLYGVSTGGGEDYLGSIFQLSRNGQLKVLYDFLAPGIDLFSYGAYPDSPLLEYSPGSFLGTTIMGGAYCYTGEGCGTVYGITSQGEFQQFYLFPRPGGAVEPDGYLAVAADGNVYGTTPSGPTTQGGGGGVYRISPEGEYTFLDTLNGTSEGDNINGFSLGSDGRLYSASFGGGTGGTGTVFAVDTWSARQDLYQS